MFNRLFPYWTASLGILILCSQLQGNEVKKILCTTFPIYQITRNLTNGCALVQVDLLLPSQLGCPHHYSLTPQDLRKLSQAHILIINGLGMESFLDHEVRNPKYGWFLIDSSQGLSLKELIKEEKEEEHEEKDDHHHEVNPHLFVSPSKQIPIATTISQELSKLIPQGQPIFEANLQTYIQRMEGILAEIKTMKGQWKKQKLIQPHGVFDYFIEDLGLEIVGTMQPHGREPSAKEMKDLIELIRKEDVGAILLEPQYPEKVGRRLSEETGIPVILLDPVNSGPDSAPLDYYDKKMRENLKKLSTLLGNP